MTHVEVHPPVRAIREIAFLWRTKLTSVTLGVGLEIIGKGAFQECTSLRVIPIPNAVRAMKLGGFKKCTRLRTLFLGEGLRNIGDRQGRRKQGIQ